MYWKAVPTIIVIALVTLSLSCKKKVVEPEEEEAPDPTYVGHAACAPCHQIEYNNHQKTGHANALKKIDSGQAPVYPFQYEPPMMVIEEVTQKFTPGAYNNVQSIPYLSGWDQVSYVIGGYKWYALVLDSDGSLVTGSEASYILFDNYSSSGTKGPWPIDNTSGQGTVPFDCGSCHTTVYSADGSQGGLAGIVGTWEEEGVQCEACHGPGSEHCKTSAKEDITKDPFVCKNCHTSGDNTLIEVGADGMIMANQQWEEMQAGSHSTSNPLFSAKGCVTCHSDPHIPYAYNEAATVPDRKSICLTCHTKDRWAGAAGMSSTKDLCAECHMPHVVSGGLPATLFLDSAGMGYNPHSAVRSHVFSILSHPTLTAQDTMYDASLSSPFLKKDSLGRAFMTLDMACISCHDYYHAISFFDNPMQRLDSLGRINMQTFPLDPAKMPPQ